MPSNCTQNNVETIRLPPDDKTPTKELRKMKKSTFCPHPTRAVRSGHLVYCFVIFAYTSDTSKNTHNNSNR
ncbi:unnamed protein product [Ceratitis capitata]|uniref:(Mediterranean fruit fly) hypothetical protein n=1 Tax=Ceratitis capitata TaxID=7213 RepID=A0A811V107_CERCA|nr:unnamed protein product [Ceratitis capitata]